MTVVAIVIFQYEAPNTFDDSGVNGIALVCMSNDLTDTTDYGHADSHHGPWGEWMETLMCNAPEEDNR